MVSGLRLARSILSHLEACGTKVIKRRCHIARTLDKSDEKNVFNALDDSRSISDHMHLATRSGANPTGLSEPRWWAASKVA
jgi:hypothetical protein